MAEKLTICLVGPRGGGKSSMLAAATDCIVQSAHGYSPDLRPTMQSITRAAFHGFDSVSAKLDIFDGLVDDYQKLRRAFAEGGAPTDARGREYFFRLTLHGDAPREIREKAPCLLRIIDAAGGVAIPDETAPADALTEIRDDFATKLLSADAIVFVLPLVRFEDSGWVGDMARLFERLALAPDQKLRRVIVAFSHYERLFVRLGPSAFTYACDPAVALHVLRRSLRSAPWIDSLRALETGAKVDIRFTVTSAYGFVKTFQNPNIDPHREGERRFRREGVAGSRALNEFWRPFLAVDPILYAALALESAFMFSYAQIDGSAQKPAALR
ncbi:MAG: hypothetical protein C3F11_22380 [Methylocystaceae bacterium]|nr:MAG: hypothetical protein C3F11_22380 [Methylocystaceae bacterium]